ncbi:MAG: lysophospholipid acyltransferase family protein [Patescibacteria group bacterium]
MQEIILAITHLLFKKSIVVDGIEHLPKGGPYIIAANHNDYLDGYRIVAAINPYINCELYFLSKTNNYWWTKTSIQINKDDRSETIREAVEKLKESCIIAIFPEGRRNFEDKLLPGKTGTVRMSLLGQAPIVPIGIIGTGAPTFGQSVKAWLKNTQKYKINIGKSIDLKKYYKKEITSDLLEKLTNNVMKEIARLGDKKAP